MQEHVCKSCGNKFAGRFCNNCGEKIYSQKDKKISHLFEEGLHFVTHFEGTFLTSLKTIVFSPGKLSDDFCFGIRKRYFKPLSFFLMLVILYLLFPVFEGLNMRLYYHTSHDLYGVFAQKKVASVMAAKHLSFEQVSDIFHNKGEKVSKFLLFIILPAMAAISWLLAFKKRRYYYDHFIYSTENTSFFMLWGFLLLPLIMVILRVFLGNQVFQGDFISGSVIIIGMLIFTFISARRFFKFSSWYSIIYTILYLGLLVLFVQYIYKFLLFYLSIIQV